MYKNKKISLVFPAYNEEDNIKEAIIDFRKLKIIDEIIVVDNNSKDKTSKIARSKKARVVTEKRQGYGYALRRGLKIAKGDYVVLCEPDGTYIAKDLLRLLSHIENYDIVTGTRTNPKYIRKKANMHGFLRLGNIVLAKIMQFLYSPSSHLSDCGCTFKIINKKSLKRLLPRFSVGGSHFLSEFTTLCFLLGFKTYEVPVTYRERVGQSKITGSLTRSVIVGFQMFRTIVLNRLKAG